MSRELMEFQALSFDCYGTLIDWETGIWDALQPLLARNGACDITRARVLEAFAVVESAQQAETPELLYPELLSRVHGRLARRLGLSTSATLDAAFGASVPAWPAFPDSAAALHALSRRYRLILLSNADRAGLAASIGRLGVRFDAAYTAEEIGCYKPDPRAFEYMLRRLEADHSLTAGQILHTAQSLFHDHVPAAACGLARAWIDRQGLSGAGPPRWGATAPVADRPQVDFVFPDLRAMAAAVEAAARL